MVKGNSKQAAYSHRNNIYLTPLTPEIAMTEFDLLHFDNFQTYICDTTHGAKVQAARRHKFPPKLEGDNCRHYIFKNLVRFLIYIEIV